MGHYLSEMEGGELDEAGRESLARLERIHERERALCEARNVGMTAALEHLVRNSPLPVSIEYAVQHLGVGGRNPEAEAVYEAVRRLTWGKDTPLDHGHDNVIRARR